MRNRTFAALPTLLVALSLVSGAHGVAAQSGSGAEFFERGVTWSTFLEQARAQRDQWLKVTSTAHATADDVRRMTAASRDLRLLVVAEDWCPDSVNALPHIAALASAASIPLRIVDRTTGAALMNRHRTVDGRAASPTIVLLRGEVEAAAWVERPAIVQQWFLTMAASAQNAMRFADRQAWFDADAGRTTRKEIIALAEGTSTDR
jgi:hypothetical protein